MHNRLKQITALSVAFCLIATSFVFASSDEVLPDMSKYQQKIEMLKMLGIADFKSSTFEQSKSVTREEFCDAAAGLLNIQDISGAVSMFKDVTSNMKGILILESLGLLNGNESGMFYPKDEIEYFDAIKILVSILGYDKIAEKKGGYPLGYLATASEIGLTANTAQESNVLTFGQLIDILEQVISTKILYVYKVSIRANEKSIEYAADKNYTVLSMYKDIYKGKGIISANNTTALSDTRHVQDNQIEIDEYVYNLEYDKAHDFLGCYVTYYYRKSDETVVYAELSNKMDIIKVTHKQITGYSKGVFSYEDEGKDKKINIDFGANIIYNGQYYGSVTEDDFTPDYGSVTFLDAHNDGIYETIIIEAISIAVVGAVDTDNLNIYDMYLNKDNDKNCVYKHNSLDVLSVIDENGVLADFSKISRGDVIELKISKGAPERIVVIKELKMTEMPKSVSEISSATDDDMTIAFSDNLYNVSAYLKRMFKAGNIVYPKLGIKYHLYLSTAGEIAFLTQSGKDEQRFGYIIRADTDSKKGVGRKLKLRILDQDGEVLDFDIAGSIVIDGKKTSRNDAVSNISDLKAMLERKFIIYKINLSGEITDIDSENYVPAYETEKTLMQNGTSSEIDYRQLSLGYTFGGKVLITNNTYVFAVPEKESELADNMDYYKVFTPNDVFVAYKKYDVIGYSKEGEHGIISDIVKINSEKIYPVFTGDTHPVLVNSIGQILENDEIKMSVKGYINGALTTLAVTDERGASASAITSGDIIRVSRSVNGGLIIPSADPYYIDYSKNTADGNTVSAKFPASSYSSTVLYRLSNLIKIDGSYITVADDAFDKKEKYNIANSKLFYYDSEKEQFRHGEISDLISYDISPNNYSKLFVLSTNTISYIVIYNIHNN